MCKNTTQQQQQQHNNNNNNKTNSGCRTMTIEVPVVTKDPRFLAGRKLCERGLADEAIEIYATLLEEASQKYGSSSIETGPAYYEYGNSLLRATTKKLSLTNDSSESPIVDNSGNCKQSAVAAAAEKRLQSSVETTKDEEVDDTKPKAVKVGIDGDTNHTDERERGKSDGRNDDGEYFDDLNLGLEMMENAFSILEEYRANNEKNIEDNTISDNDGNKYYDWVKEQIPRVLVGIGDTLSNLNKHADAADTYSRALELRKLRLQDFDANTNDKDSNQCTIDHLRAHRLVCEASILIAEELLSCPENEDVITTETQTLIVKAKERFSYARGYYDQARDSLVSAL